MYDLTLDIVFEVLAGLESSRERFSVMRRHHTSRATKPIEHVGHERRLGKAIRYRSLERKSPWYLKKTSFFPPEDA